jgi:hypothetical protein
MATWQIDWVVDDMGRIDITDERQMEYLASLLPDFHWSYVDDSYLLTAFVDAENAFQGAQIAVCQLAQHLPSVRLGEVELAIASISDVAELAEVHRETARLWVLGKRGPGNFPRPLGVTGEGQRVFESAKVIAWLEEKYGLSFESKPATLAEKAAIDEYVTAAAEAVVEPSPVLTASVYSVRVTNATWHQKGVQVAEGPYEAPKRRTDVAVA